MRQVALACLVLGALAVVGIFVNEREPAPTWLFFPYAGFWAAILIWTASCFAIGHAALRLLPPLRVRFRERVLFDFATGAAVRPRALRPRIAGPGDPAALVAAADFVVVEQSCQWKATPEMMAPFAEGSPWGSYSLWVRRP